MKRREATRSGTWSAGSVATWSGSYSGGGDFTNTYSVLFDGIDDYMPATLTLDAETYTVTSWLKFNGSGSGGYWFDSRDGSNTNAIAVYSSESGGNERLIVYKESVSKITTSYDIPRGTWVHIALVKNGATINLYKNGVLWETVGSLSNHSNGATFNLATRYTLQDEFGGNIDEVGVWDSALSAAQILSIYGNGAPASLTSYSPVGWWRMGDNNDGAGTTITDMGSGGNDGTLENGPVIGTDVPVPSS